MNDLVINVYGIEYDSGHEIVPIYLSQQKSNKEAIHLLMLETKIYSNGDDVDMEDGSVYHFAWIRNLSRLLKSQITKRKGYTKLCDRCLCHFTTVNSFEKHRLDCANINKCRVILPDEKDKIMKFKNYKYKEPVPFAVYADIECILEPIADKSNSLNTTLYQRHVPHSIAYYLQCNFDDTISKFRAYRGKNCVEWFTNQLQEL
ncbi:uncharacterized protein LOC107274135, partial [Cephus cinctus]|uniref:Uncharacterized protein LOC107274135 n=1 Tax=Cephus cinctus TaxID=211228 RepID=A0AAJ7CEA0_CEPCN